MATKADHRAVLDHILAHGADPATRDWDYVLGLVGELRANLHNRRVLPRAPVSSVSMCDELRQRIRALKRHNPSLSQQQIAEMVGTNQGRVNNALIGVRG